jgi:hypothetical protein
MRDEPSAERPIAARLPSGEVAREPGRARDRPRRLRALAAARGAVVAVPVAGALRVLVAHALGADRPSAK